MKKGYESSVARSESVLRTTSSAIKCEYIRRDCASGHKFGTSCLILSNQKGYRRQDCASGSPIQHFVPHSQQSKGSRKVGLRIWATNSALHTSTWQSKSE